VLLDRNRITRTGARTPGGERHSPLAWRCLSAQLPRLRAGTSRFESGEHEGRMQTRRARQLGVTLGEGPFDMPALKPYWGKPAVRNFRGDDGNVGIIRRPVRAIALPDSVMHVANTRTGSMSDPPNSIGCAKRPSGRIGCCPKHDGDMRKGLLKPSPWRHQWQ
jgi:hypothetical protein